MPQAQSMPTEDDYWAATDKKLVTLRGVVEYVGGTICGSTKSRNNFPDTRLTSYTSRAFSIGSTVYGDQPYTILPVSQTISTPTSGYAGQARQIVYGEWQGINIITDNAASGPINTANQEYWRTLIQQQAEYNQIFGN